MSIWFKSQLPKQADVVVIGGGIAGASVAYHLANEGVHVVLFEAGEIASRATGRNDGQILVGTCEHYNRIVSHRGREDARKLLEFVQKNNSELRSLINYHIPEAVPGTWGGIHFAETEAEFKELEEAVKLMKEDGVECSVIEAGNIKLPVEGFHGAMRIASEAIVHPVAMTRGLLRRAIDLGASIYPHHPVSEVIKTDDGHAVRLEDGQEIQTLVVVHCTSALGTELDQSGFLKSQIFPYRGQIIATDSLGASKVSNLCNLAMSSNFGYEYFRVYQDRFLLGGMRWSVKGQEENTTNDRVSNSDITRNLLEYADKHFPTLRGVKFPHVWTGIMAGTNDGLPIVGGIPGQQGVFALTAFNGYGLSFAFKAGEVIKDQIVNGQSDNPAASMLDPRRFT